MKPIIKLDYLDLNTPQNGLLGSMKMELTIGMKAQTFGLCFVRYISVRPFFCGLLLGR